MSEKSGGKTSSAVKRRYNEKAYDRITIFVKSGEKDRIKQFAETHGQSVNAFITELIRREMLGFKSGEDE